MSGIIADILMWPQVAMWDVRAVPSQWWRPVVAAGVTVFLMGVPSADMDMMALGQWYATMGASLYAVNLIPAGGNSYAEPATSAY